MQAMLPLQQFGKMALHRAQFVCNWQDLFGGVESWVDNCSKGKGCSKKGHFLENHPPF